MQIELGWQRCLAPLPSPVPLALAQVELLREDAMSERTPPETWPQEPQTAWAGKTTYTATYHCAGRIQSDTLEKFFDCPATATFPVSQTSPAGWKYLPIHGGWHCPSCAASPGVARRPMGKWHDLEGRAWDMPEVTP